MVYIADTHALIWFLTDSKKLGPNAQELFKKAELGETIIIISTISLMEILYICKKENRVNQFKDILKKLKISLNYLTFDLDLETVLECVNLEKVNEMHDRIIVATAKIANAKIITKDLNIIKSNYTKIIW